MYELKQAGRLGSKLRHAKLVDAVLTRCLTDMCLHLKQQDSDTTTVGVCIDDLLVTTSRRYWRAIVLQKMWIQSIKNLGTVRKFLGMHVALNKGINFLEHELAIVEWNYLTNTD